MLQTIFTVINHNLTVFFEGFHQSLVMAGGDGEYPIMVVAVSVGGMVLLRQESGSLLGGGLVAID